MSWAFPPPDLTKWEKFLIYQVGPPAAWLKNKLVLSAVIGVYTTGSAIVLLVSLDEDGSRPSWVVPSVVVAALLALSASVLDWFADRYEAKLAAIEFAASEDDSELAVADLNSFVERCMMITQHTPAKQDAQLVMLRDMLVMAAAKSLPKSRASYYTLTWDPDGFRILGDPVHHSEGRKDRSDRPFLESEDPHLSIWTMLDRADTESNVVEHPSDQDKIDWEKVSYRSYYSIPVKYKSTIFGMLSVNSSEKGVISGPRRAVVLALARIYALTLLSVGKKNPQPKND